ncbi:MAG: serine hydrolase [Bacillota bacterium]
MNRQFHSILNFNYFLNFSPLLNFCSFLVFLVLFFSGSIFPQKAPGSDLIDSLLKANKDLFPEVVSDPGKYRLQILYTKIDRDKHNKPHFTSYNYRVDPKEYFYPASSVKLAGAVLSLQKLNELNVKGLNKFTPLRIDSTFSGQTRVESDKSSENGLPSIAHYIKKIFLVSDNDAFNRTYEFTGQKYINEELWKRGFKDLNLIHRVSVALSRDENRHTNPFTFYNGDKVIFKQNEQYNPVQYKNQLPGVLIGKGYYSGDSLVNEPKDFSYNNYISVENLQGILRSVMFPSGIDKKHRFNLKEDDYRFLRKYMSMLPRESSYPHYDPKEEWDSYCKFLIFGDKKDTIPQNIRIFNKIGVAYGFMIDNAYIVDFDKNIEFMLTAVIYVNEDQIFNDDKYEYDKIGFPFMGNLGRVIYNYELNRTRKFKPDLTEFKFNYTKDSSL